jgi:ssDNA-binding replication factor A large subunit
MAQPEEFKVVSDLRPGLRGINVKVKCLSKNEEREVVSKNTGDALRVTEALVGDQSGSILLTLWNDDIDKIELEKVYQLNNTYTSVFKGSLRLNIGRDGTAAAITEAITEVNETNNLSDKIYEDRRSFRPSYGGDRSSSRGYGGGGGGRSGGYDRRGSSGDNRGYRRRY